MGMLPSPSTVASQSADAQFVAELITRLETDCPKRESASADELRTQEILGDELAARGLDVELHPFRYSPSLYAVLALHFAIATLGSACYLSYPWVGAVLHALVAISYALDAHYRGFWLRRWLPWRTSHNLVATRTPDEEIRRRVVMIAHADAAPTGWMFSPSFLKLAHTAWPNKLCLLRKQMLGSMLALALLTSMDITIATTGYWFPLAYAGFTLASLIPLVLMLQIVLTNRTVPGANDNLSGCAAVVLLAERFSERPVPNTELVFVVTGCEEAGRGGAWTLERQMRGKWDPQTTLILGLDTLSGGPLRYHIEGEMLPIWPTKELQQAVAQVAAADERYGPMQPYHAPAGATDVAPFVWRGYDGLCVTRINPQSDIPPNYHVPSDCAANIDADDVVTAVDFAEALVRYTSGELASSRLQRDERIETSRTEAFEIERDEAEA